MDWEMIGAIGEVLGAAGVIITLGFLAYQVIQTKLAIRSSSYQSYAQQRRDTIMMFASEDTQSVFVQGLNDAKSLNEGRRHVFHSTFFNFMSMLQTIHRMWREKQITDDDWECDLILLKEIKGAPVFPLWWPAVQRGFTRDFVNTVDAAESVADLGIENFFKALDEQTVSSES